MRTDEARTTFDAKSAAFIKAVSKFALPACQKVWFKKKMPCIVVGPASVPHVARTPMASAYARTILSVPLDASLASFTRLTACVIGLGTRGKMLVAADDVAFGMKILSQRATRTETSMSVSSL